MCLGAVCVPFHCLKTCDAVEAHECVITDSESLLNEQSTIVDDYSIAVHLN